jgi:hypothetical protein
MNLEANHKKISAIIATTFLAISILMMYPILQETANASSPTFPNDGVRLLATHTQPRVLQVGNFFHTSAIVFNNSPGTISFIAGPCDSPLAATFDKNVLVKHGVGCLVGSAAAHLVKLRPGGTAQVLGPRVGTMYQAIASGKTIATVTFHYQTGNGANASVNKSFEFNII